MKGKRLAILSTITLVMCVAFVTSTALAEEKPVGKVAITSRAIAVGIGVQWGEGTLSFQGKDYKFSLKGLRIVDLGISKLKVDGDVFKLTKLEDFNGTYMSGSAGISLAGGTQGSIMKNQNGVILRLLSDQEGIRFTLAPEGVKLQLK